MQPVGGHAQPEGGKPSHRAEVRAREHSGARQLGEATARRLCRTICRPAVANSRIEPAPGARVVLRRKRRWSDGTTGRRLTDLELVQRLAAVAPPPHANMLLHHGVFAPSAAWRGQVLPALPGPEPSRGRLTKRNRIQRADQARRRWPRCGAVLLHSASTCSGTSLGTTASDARGAASGWWFAP